MMVFIYVFLILVPLIYLIFFPCHFSWDLKNYVQLNSGTR